MTGSGLQPNGSWPPFERGNLAAVRHGAYSKRLTGPLAEQIAAEQLARDDCPLWLREPSYASAVLAWAFAEAECVQLRARRDELERLAGGDHVDASLTETTEATETETRPAPGAMTRVSVAQQRESLARALHRSETRARTLRNDLGLSPASRAKLGRDILGTGRADLAMFWAELADEDDREPAGS